MRIKSSIFIFFVLVMLLNACAVDSSVLLTEPASQKTPIHSETIIENYVTEQAIITPASTATQTLTPEPVNGSTPTREIGLTPTIEKTQFSIQKDFLLEVIESNGGCDFPCVWGITPGETKYFEAEKMFESVQSGYQDNIKLFNEKFENIPSASISLDYFTYTPDIQESTWVFYDYIEDEKTIVFISFGYSKYIYQTTNSEMEIQNFNDLPINEVVSEYKLSTVLQKFGKPDEVYIGIKSTIGPERNRYDLFDLVLYYRKLGFVIHYCGDLKISDQNFSVCLNNTDIRFKSWDINYVLSSDYYKDHELVLIMNPDAHSFDFKRNSFEETFLMAIDNFVRFYSNPEYQECLNTTADLWE